MSVLSGSIDDLAHCVSVDCLADPLTKSSAKYEYLAKAVNTSILPNVDKNIPSRDMMPGRNKEYLAAWLCQNIRHAQSFERLMGVGIWQGSRECFQCNNHAFSVLTEVETKRSRKS